MKIFWVEWADTRNLIGTVEAENEQQARNCAVNQFGLNFDDFVVREKPAAR